MKILGIEIEDAYHEGKGICRKGKKKERSSYSMKHSISNIKAKNLQQLLWLLMEIKHEGIRPEDIDFSILQEVIMKKLNVSQRKAYDLGRALQFIECLY